MINQRYFIICYQVWLASLIIVNLTAVLFLALLTKDQDSISALHWGIPSIFANLAIGFLNLIYVIFQAMRYRPNIIDQTISFDQWVWFCHEPSTKAIIAMAILFWIILNTISLFAFRGFLIVTGIHFILSFIYLLSIGIMVVIISFKNDQGTGQQRQPILKT